MCDVFQQQIKYYLQVFKYLKQYYHCDPVWDKVECSQALLSVELAKCSLTVYSAFCTKDMSDNHLPRTKIQEPLHSLFRCLFTNCL